MEIREQKIKLSGVANIPQPLEMSKDYDLQITNAEVRKIEEIPNDDGTMDKQFCIKISEMSEVFISFGKEIIKARKKGSQAQILRYKLQDMADKLGKEREDYYKRYMSALIEKIDEKLKN